MHDAVYYSSNLEATEHPTRPISFLFAKMPVVCDIYGNNNNNNNNNKGSMGMGEVVPL